MILGAGVYVAWQGYASRCPCGFDFDPLTGGCKVHLGPVDCGGGGQSGAPSTGSSGNTGSGSGAAEPAGGAGNRPNSCLYSTNLCRFDRARQTVSVEVEYNGSVIPNSGSAPPIDVKLLSERPNDCLRMRATFTGGNPRGFTIDLPVNAGSLAAASSSTAGPPFWSNPSLNSSNSCPGTPAVVKIAANPANSPCGCAVTFPN